MMLRFEARPARGPRPARPVVQRLPGAAPLIDEARVATVTARAALLARQSRDGCWHGEASVDVGLTARMILLDLRIGTHDPEKAKRLCRALRRAQAESGGWTAGGEGAIDLASSVLAYFALKVGGASAADSDLRRARRAIAEQGGLAAIEGDARRWLAMFGQTTFPGVSTLIELSPQRGVAELNGAPTDGASSLELATAVVKPADPLAETMWQAAMDNRPVEIAHRLRAEPADSLWVEALRDPALDTAAALCGLLATGAEPAEAAVAAGRSVIGGGPVDRSTEASALALLALLDSPRRRDAGPWLRVAQEEDGVELVGEEVNPEARTSLAESLLAQQQDDGSWHVAGRPDIAATATAVRALAGAAENAKHTAAAEAGRAFLVNHQQLSGGWTSASVDDGRATPLALLALAGEPEAHRVPVEAAANWLLADQQADGAWADGDAAATAVAIEALVKSGVPIGPLEPSVGWLLAAAQEGGGWAGPGGAFCPRATAAALAALVAWRSAAREQLSAAPRPTLRLVGV